MTWSIKHIVNSKAKIHTWIDKQNEKCEKHCCAIHKHAVMQTIPELKGITNFQHMNDLCEDYYFWKKKLVKVCFVDERTDENGHQTSIY